MKKFTIIAAIFILCTVLVTPQASADYVPAGLSFTLNYAAWNNHYGGGEFAVYEPAGSTTVDFYTFCVEKLEYFTPGQTLYVGSVGTTIKYNGGNSTIPGAIPLDQRAAKLFHDFVAGTLPVWVSHSSTYDQYLQEAIWFFQYGTPITTGANTNPYITNATYTGWSGGTLDVVVMNLWGDANYTCAAQDQLGTIPGTQVPEPGTLLLVGLGLIGVAGLRRKNS
jgi:hypothetical protein